MAPNFTIGVVSHALHYTQHVKFFLNKKKSCQKKSPTFRLSQGKAFYKENQMAQLLIDYLEQRSKTGDWTPTRKQVYSWKYENTLGINKCLTTRSDGRLYVKEGMFSQWLDKYQETYPHYVSRKTKASKACAGETKKPLILQMNNKMYVDLHELTNRLNRLVAGG